ncbi:hypothetical protein EW146_g1212 [Bondarzewia mesenterica]|uniref:Ras GEF n=1 Tax=Bondarzewia mesenterica TaxID=1095465 RepID=A0A4S4M652_9AGAM|nr:hypothetical protein EW146_g1212 [Bondarzewia mesenterica]
MRLTTKSVPPHDPKVNLQTSSDLGSTVVPVPHQYLLLDGFSAWTMQKRYGHGAEGSTDSIGSKSRAHGSKNGGKRPVLDMGGAVMNRMDILIERAYQEALLEFSYRQGQEEEEDLSGKVPPRSGLVRVQLDLTSGSFPFLRYLHPPRPSVPSFPACPPYRLCPLLSTFPLSLLYLINLRPPPTPDASWHRTREALDYPISIPPLSIYLAFSSSFVNFTAPSTIVAILTSEDLYYLPSDSLVRAGSSDLKYFGKGDPFYPFYPISSTLEQLATHHCSISSCYMVTMAPSAELRIDTSVIRVSGPLSTKSLRGGSLMPESTEISAANRLRNPSPISTSSSLSLTSPAPSSTNASSSSIHLPLAPAYYSTTSVSTAPSTAAIPVAEKIQTECVLAMHDFVPQQKNATCLAFRAGQIIHVLNRDASGWWDGELDGKRGWFPSNYVNGDLGILADDVMSPIPHARSGHSHSKSTVSMASFASSTSSRQSAFSRNDYCPPLMVPLLHALSLLQNAVRANRVTHFQPSVACVISCVRSVLAAADCLSRDAPLLKRYSSLAQERRRVLSDLAAIVTQAKKASAEGVDEDQRDLEVEKMVRLGGQVFSRVRRFLAVAVQCGVDLPERQPVIESHSTSSDSGFSSQSSSSSVQEPTTPASRFDEDDTFHAPQWKATGRPRMRVKAEARFDADAKTLPSLVPEKLEQLNDRGLTNGRLVMHKHDLSVGSSTSSSSFSSADSTGTPITPPFPSGPSTYEELMEALRHTHDQYLSTIAAFIGHAHSHSRTSHASSTGHMYELVREIVEMVCKLLTIVEAVLRHPTVPPHKAAHLKAAKEGLYSVTSALAESVRMLTTTLPATMTEDQEKATLIRSATDALKAGADCVAAVKMCLTRSTSDKLFIVELPRVSEDYAVPLTPRKLLHRMSPRLSKSMSMTSLTQSSADLVKEEEIINQPQSLPEAQEYQIDRPIIEISEELDTATSKSLVDQVDGVVPMSEKPSHERKVLSALTVSRDVEVAPDLPSPMSSITRTDDDGMTWEGSQRQHERAKSLEEKILNGDLPSIPMSELMQADSEPWMLPHDYSLEDVAYNGEGHLVGATIEALIEKMTPHASIVDPAFSAVFFLTFRLFSSPLELVQTIIDRYNLLPPPGLSEENTYKWQQRKGIPVRLRVSNFIKVWLEMYWRPSSDHGVLDLLLNFNRDALSLMFPGPSQRIHELIVMRMQQADVIQISPRTDRIRDAGMPLNPPTINSPSEIPRPVMTKSLLANLRNKNFSSIYITDFDSLELARQMTIMECTLFCAIQPEEVLESGQEGAKAPLNVKAVTSLSTVITGWVAESILSESDPKKRTALVKFFIKVADRCTTLSNFSTSRSILAALDSSTISRLHQTWAGVPQKQKLQLESIRKLADHARNYRDYRSRLRNTAPPAVPFLGLYLTDVTFCREGNPSHRASPMAADKKLLNFNKYHKMARIVQDMQRFQVPYTLKEIPEVQAYLTLAFENSRHHGDLQDLYRRSLLVEPKQPADTPPSGDVRQLFTWAGRSLTGQPASAS